MKMNWDGVIPDEGFADNGDFVVLYGEVDGEEGLPTAVIYDYWYDTPLAHKEAFEEKFDIINAPSLSRNLASLDFYQGLKVMSVIRRKSDGQLFGFQWWDDISKHGDAYIESNYDEFFEVDYAKFSYKMPEIHVYTPVEEFTITGYRHTKEGK